MPRGPQAAGGMCRRTHLAVVLTEIVRNNKRLLASLGSEFIRAACEKIAASDGATVRSLAGIRDL
jgi:hypothetical protein